MYWPKLKSRKSSHVAAEKLPPLDPRSIEKSSGFAISSPGSSGWSSPSRRTGSDDRGEEDVAEAIRKRIAASSNSCRVSATSGSPPDIAPAAATSPAPAPCRGWRGCSVPTAATKTGPEPRVTRPSAARAASATAAGRRGKASATRPAAAPKPTAQRPAEDPIIATATLTVGVQPREGHRHRDPTVAALMTLRRRIIRASAPGQRAGDVPR
jgi:hypothetical protein